MSQPFRVLRPVSLFVLLAVAAVLAAAAHAQQAQNPQAQRPQLQQPQIQLKNPQVLAPQSDQQQNQGSGEASGCYTGLVKSLRIAPSGEITEITLSSPSNRSTPRFRGCGAKIGDLPFLWDLQQDQEPIAEFCWRDSCLSAINLLW